MISLDELKLVVFDSFDSPFLPCEYSWLHNVSKVRKVPIPKIQDIQDKERKKMKLCGFHVGHHFKEDSSFPIIKLLKETKNLEYDKIEMGSTRTPADIYAYTKQGVIQIEVGGITNICKLIPNLFKNVLEIWLYNYKNHVYIFENTPIKKWFHRFVGESQPQEFFNSAEKNLINNCVFSQDQSCSFSTCYKTFLRVYFFLKNAETLLTKENGHGAVHE